MSDVIREALDQLQAERDRWAALYAAEHGGYVVEDAGLDPDAGAKALHIPVSVGIQHFTVRVLIGDADLVAGFPRRAPRPWVGMDGPDPGTPYIRRIGILNAAIHQNAAQAGAVFRSIVDEAVRDTDSEGDGR